MSYTRFDNNSEALYALGNLYFDGHGVGEDKYKAVDLHLKAAEQGHIRAQYNLGFEFLLNEINPNAQYTDIFYRWLQHNAALGQAPAQYRLGLIYSSEMRIHKDNELAFENFKKAAYQDHTDAQFKLAEMYEQGLGIVADQVLAMDWLQKAANSGHAEAQYKLGNKYIKGYGVEQDLTAGAGWLFRAEMNGHAEAIEQLRKLRIPSYSV